MIQDSISKSSLIEAPRSDATTNYVDWWSVRTGPAKLLNVFGYNSLAAIQWIQIFDATSPTRSVTVTAASDIITVGGGLEAFNNGERVQWIGARGISSGTIVYVGKVIDGVRLGDGIYKMFTTQALALNGGSGDVIDLTSDGAITINYMPMHTQGVAASDNYSNIIPVTGIGCGRGITIANSTTAPTYTAGAKNVTMLTTFVPLI